MCSVWVCVPSARPVADVEVWAAAWRSQGYKIALWRDSMDFPYGTVDYIRSDPYPGYALAVNSLVHDVLQTDNECDWTVTGGDDVICERSKSAEEIARECSEHFTSLHMNYADYEPPEHAQDGVHPFTMAARLMTGEQMQTYGVMQPTGHRFGEDPTNPNPAMRSAYIDRVAGSAWMGREWCRRINQGKGPLWPEFQHMHVDEALRAVAVKLGVYWERTDLTHFHNHWGLPQDGERHGRAERMPEHLKKWNTPEHWRESKAILDRLKAEDFKSCLPL